MEKAEEEMDGEEQADTEEDAENEREEEEDAVPHAASFHGAAVQCDHLADVG